MIRWSWKKANWEKYEDIVKEETKHEMEGSLRNKIVRWNEVICKAAKESIPTKKASWKNKPFWDEQVDEVRRRRDACRGTNKEEREERAKLNVELAEIIREKKRKYWK